jgi:cellulose synthase/poly-beta-1,6-N-acetylglucosamine synthase-like glycosyltransferase
MGDLGPAARSGPDPSPTISATSMRQSARLLFARTQAWLVIMALIAAAAGLVAAPVGTLRLLMAAVIAFWLAMTGIKLTLAVAASRTVPSGRLADITDPTLPSFTVLVPLYHEANMIAGLRDALARLRYPADKVQVMLLLEAHDLETIAAAQAAEVPFLEIPPGGPQNKPNALNFGLAQATGDLTVVYDAEDRPDPDQLLAFVQRFREDRERRLACVQARLMFWNGDSSWVARFYWVEYIIHFEWVLRGLSLLRLIPPLGGTSNCFRTRILRQVAFPPEQMPFREGYVGAWDPWNVTEDADLAGALALLAYDVDIIDSITWEEAPSRLKVALGQRSRWLKGYLHTGLVYSRHPLRMAGAMGPVRYGVYVLLMLGTPVSILLTPIFWALTIVYFLTHSTLIQSLFPGPLLYAGAVLMLVGNLFQFFQRVWACVHRGSDGGVTTMLLSPIWEMLGIVVLMRVVNELSRKRLRHRWVKTEHGHDRVRDERRFATAAD